MRQDQIEKKIVEQIQRISIPVPDSEYEQMLRAKFIKKASRKRKASRIAGRLTWVGGFAIVAIVAILFVTGDLVQEQNNVADKYSAETNPGEQGIMSILAIEDQSTQRKIVLKDQVSIADAQLFEVYNYVGGEPSGEWRFYQNQDSKQIYISRNQIEAFSLYGVNDGYVSTHIYPLPNAEDQFLLIMIEGKDGDSTKYTLFHMDEKGYLTEITGIPPTGYNDAGLLWSPNGKEALVKLENSSTKSVLVGIVKEDLTFTKIYGEIDPNATIDWMATDGAHKVSFATWLSEQTILLFYNEQKVFYQIDIETGRTNPLKVTESDLMSANVLQLYSIGQQQLAILKVGNMRYDVGFEPSHHLYLLDLEQRLIVPIEPDQQYAGLPYMQSYLGTSREGNQIILDIFQGDDYQLSFRLFDPEGKDVMWQYDHNFSRTIANPLAAFSPDQNKIAIRLYSEEEGTAKDGSTYDQSAPSYFLILDLENRKTTTMEFEEYALPEWIDNNTVKIGENIINISKKLQ